MVTLRIKQHNKALDLVFGKYAIEDWCVDFHTNRDLSDFYYIMLSNRNKPHIKKQVKICKSKWLIVD